LPSIQLNPFLEMEIADKSIEITKKDSFKTLDLFPLTDDTVKKLYKDEM
jgi:hypothetical protein